MDLPFRSFVPSVLVGAALVFVAPRAAARPGRDMAIEARILGEVRDASSEAADLVQAGTLAMDDGRFPEAEGLFRKAAALAPASDHVQRRLCGALAGEGRLGEAVTACRRAVLNERDTEAADLRAANHFSLGGCLLSQKDTARSALPELRRAVELDPKDDDAHETLCFARVFVTQKEPVGDCQQRLETSENPMAALALAALAIEGERRDEAARFIARAERLGASPASITGLREALNPPYWRTVSLATLVLVGLVSWASMLLVLLVLGTLLGRSALRVSDEILQGRFAQMPKTLRRFYKALIGASGIYFYFSLPLLAFIVIALVGGLFLAAFAAGHFPVKVLLIVGIAGVATVVAIVNSIGAIFFKRELDPGDSLSLSAHPKLNDLLRDIAERMGTRPVDRVFITPFTSLAVFERKRNERCLILGVGVLEGMSTRAFASVLAHEYGHFRNEDTAGGHVALAVRRSMSRMVESLVQGGAVSIWNPAVWFLRSFAYVFERASAGSSRLQEVLADYFAVKTFGSEAFVSGFSHVIERTVRFNAHANASLGEVVTKKVALANLYAFSPDTSPKEEDLMRAVSETIARDAHLFDSHPPPHKRLAQARALDIPAPDLDMRYDAQAWDLFADRAALEKEMTAKIRVAIEARHGVAIPID